MNTWALIIRPLRPTAQGVTALDRWHGLQAPWSSGGGVAWVWTTVILLTLVACATLAAILSYSYMRRRKKWATFVAHGTKAGLNEDEMKLLRHIAGLIKLKTVVTIYTAEGLFNRAVTRLMRHRRTIAMSGSMRANQNALVASMREKLGFRPPLEETSEVSISSRQIEVGSTVFVTLPGHLEAVSATVFETDRSAFIVETAETVECQSGDDCVVRHSVGSAAWEFDSQVVYRLGRKLTLNHAQDVRLINRRRFPRVRVDMRAHVARLPFFGEDAEQETPEFVPAKVVEMGGPGLLVLQSSLEARVGERILITIRLAEDRLVQASGRVRRKSADTRDGRLLAVELVGLDPGEMAELVRQTNLAAVQQAREQIEPAEAAIR
jgi:hypothetical protein